MVMFKHKPTKSLELHTGVAVGFNLLHNSYAQGTWQKRVTVAQLEYMRMRVGKSEGRLILCAEGCNTIHQIHFNFTIDNIQEYLKRITALAIERGEMVAKSELEAELVKQHLRWCRSPDYDKYKSYPATDGIVNRFVLTMREFPNQKWDKKYTKIVRLEVRLDGQLQFKEISHLPWTSTLREIAQQCAERAQQRLKNLSIKFKADGRLIESSFDQQLGDLGMFSDRLHLEVEMIYTIKGEKPPAYKEKY